MPFLFRTTPIRPAAFTTASLVLGLAGCPSDSGETASGSESSSSTDESTSNNPSTSLTSDPDTTTAPGDTSVGPTTDDTTSTDATTTSDTTSVDDTTTSVDDTTTSGSTETTGGAVCGNDAIEGDEVCDGADLGGEDCSSQGRGDGTLACLADCTGFDTSSCAVANECADQFAAEIGSPVATGSTEMEDDDLDGSCGSFGGNDLVVEFTAPEDGVYAFDSFGSDFDTEIALFTDCTGSTELACNDDSAGTLQSQVTLEMTAGQVVLVMVDGFSAQVGNVVLNIAPAPVCGDGVAASPAEICDGDDVGGMTCGGLGLGGDVPTCAADCLSFETASCDPPTGYGNCWLAPFDEVCTVDEECVLDGLGGALCLEFGCADVSDCGPALPTGTAPATCADIGNNGIQECYLSCEMGETCPDGMVCDTGLFCSWPGPGA